MFASRFAVVVAVAIAVASLASPARAEATVPTLSAAHGPRGSEITASARDWTGCRLMSVSAWGRTLGSAPVDASGAFALSFTVPGDAPAGFTHLQFSPTCSHSTWMPLVAFMVTDGSAVPDLTPTAITFDSTGIVAGTAVRFDSGIRNLGDQATRSFNIKWYVDGREVGAYGGHYPIPANTLDMAGNSQFEWTFPGSGSYTVAFAVDVDAHVAESDEGNNTTTATVTVGQDAAGYGAEIVAQARSYRVGAVGGECKVWAGKVVSAVLARHGKGPVGGWGSPNGAYWGAFANAGGRRVTEAEARPGDLIQLNKPDDRYSDVYYAPMHTAIIVAMTGTPGTFEIRDSNLTGPLTIGEHTWTPSHVATPHGFEVNYWRFG